MADLLVKIVFWIVIVGVGLAAAYMLLGLVAILLLGTLAGLSNLVREWRLRRRMRQAGRRLSWERACERIERETGTLIVESPTLGWNITRAWWTPDDVLAQAPHPPPDPDERDPEVLSRHPFVEWCHTQYTQLDGGTALLIASYNGWRQAERLLARFPTLPKIDLWSGSLAIRDLVDEPSGGAELSGGGAVD